MIRSCAVLLAAFLLDCAFGDPKRLPHPVVYMGKLIAGLEKHLRPPQNTSAAKTQTAGFCLVFLTCSVSYGVALSILYAAAPLSPLLGFVAEIFLLFQFLAMRGLRDAGMAVYTALAAGDTDGARKALSAIVGRDTTVLDEQGIIRATVESIAENTSDGVIAPLFWFALGGLPLAAVYKAINTMDSMLGYKNDKYLHFGRAAARLDDIANFLPSRLTAFLLAAGAGICGHSLHRSLSVCLRDHARHTSPNAGWPEAAVAGALGIRLGGPNIYDGVMVEKPFLGDNTRPPLTEDIPDTCRMLIAASCLGLLVCGGLTCI